MPSYYLCPRCGVTHTGVHVTPGSTATVCMLCTLAAVDPPRVDPPDPPRSAFKPTKRRRCKKNPRGSGPPRKRSG